MPLCMYLFVLWLCVFSILSLVLFVRNAIFRFELLNTNHWFYTRYVHILIIYDQTRIDCNQILHQANSVHRNSLFNFTEENNATISFLDIPIHRINTRAETEIHRKSTSTDTVIHFTSNHPYEHKLAAFRFLLTIMQQLSLATQYKQKEWLTYCI
jgi:hypothetical protein